MVMVIVRGVVELKAYILLLLTPVLSYCYSIRPSAAPFHSWVDCTSPPIQRILHSSSSASPPTITMPYHRRIVVGLLLSAVASHALEHVKTEENYPIDMCLSYTNVCNDLLSDLDCPTKTNSVDKCKGASTYSLFQVRQAAPHHHTSRFLWCD